MRACSHSDSTPAKAAAAAEKGGSVVPFVPVASAGPARPDWSPPTGYVATPDEILAVDAWNELAARDEHFLPGNLHAKRGPLLRQRLAEVGGLDGWKQALALAAESPVWRGRTDRAAWRPCLDDILDVAKFSKLIEGGFAAWKANAAPADRPKPSKLDWLYREHGMLDPDPDCDALDAHPAYAGPTIDHREALG